MHVILVGGGIGGLAAALSLGARGMDVTVLEQSPVFGEVGAGLQLSPNATRPLFQLGLEAALRAVAFAPQAVEVRDHASGALLLRTGLGAAAEQRWGAPYLQIHRADLHALLASSLAGCAGARVQLGARVVAIEQDDASATARLADGSAVQGDVLIGCDGLRSSVRAALWGARAARFTGQTAWRGLVATEQLEAGLISPVAAVWTGAGRHFVHYPVRGGRLVNFVGVVEGRSPTAESWREPGDLHALRADFQGWPSPVRALVEAAEATWRYAIYDRPPLPRWARGRVSLLGDAAHPAPPFLAQGAGMAIEDAASLARHLSGTASVVSALQAYETERRSRTARVQSWSQRNARLFHLPSAVARPVFGAARLLDRLSGADAASRLDWLYRWEPGRAPSS